MTNPVSPEPHPPRKPPGKVEVALTKLHPELATLAAALAAHGEPAAAPFERFGVPPLAALACTDAATAAAWAITLVHGVFAMPKPGRTLIAVAKRVGNAALGVRRALAQEAARQGRIALREARPIGKKPDGAKLAA